jgi:DnaJ-class molecular chaperone
MSDPEKVKCTNCDGTGKVSQPGEDLKPGQFPQRSPAPVTLTCPSCGGSGYTEHGS